MSIAPPIRDNDGSRPCIEPHLLGRLLDKLRARIDAERSDRNDVWDGQAPSEEAAK